MSDTWKGSSTSWFTKSNWSGGVPTNSAKGTQSVVISGTTTNQPVISPTARGAADIYVAQTLTVDSTTYTVLLETQIAGQLITLSNGANLTIQGIAMGVFYGNAGTTPTWATMTGLHGALSSTPSYDSHLQLIAQGTDTLTVDTVNENFGLITIGSGDKLTISNITTGGNQQAPHGLINYGLITIASGGELDITATNGSSGTLANFYNAGWIVDNGGTLNIASSVLDGANTASSATGIDGYIVLEGGANAILSNTVASQEEVLFADTSANTLQVTAGTLFAGTVAGFGVTDTIIVNGFTGTSNATLVSNGGNTNLVTANGSVMTTITLAGTVGSMATGTNSSGQEFILLGGSTLTGSTLASGTTFGSGTITLGGTSVPTIALTGTMGATGSGTDVQVNSSLTGNGTIFIDNSATVALGNTAGSDAGITVMFGPHGSASTPNELLVNDNSSGFSGTIKNFSTNDEIVLGAKVLAQPAAGQGVALSYNTATGVLTVTDTLNSTGGAVSSTQLTIAGTATGALSTASFVALEGSSGIDIELAPTTATSFTFSTSGTGSFESPTNYTGGPAPGDIISSYETISIASGTASISSGGVSDGGFITVASGAALYDAGSLSGTGTLAVSGAATLLGTTTLASVSDAGTLVIGGNLGATGVTLTNAAANITVASNLTDNGLISGGTGTVTVAKGVTATFNGGVTAGSILDYGTIDIANTALSAINMEGASGSKVAFTGTNTLTNLTNFGSGDDIVLGTGALTSATSGGSVSLSYASGKLTVTEGTSTATVTVAGTSALSTSSFIALQGTDGVNIELVSGLNGQGFTFTGANGTSFEDPSNFSGGVAPGDTLVSGETVTIASGTALLTSANQVGDAIVTVANGANFVDTGSVVGTGTLIIGSGASATLTGDTTLGSIIDNGNLVLGGNDAVAVTITSGGQNTIASSFSDTVAITGIGTLTVNSGVTATLAAGSSVATVIDAGTIDLAGSTGGVIFLNGNNADSIADFSGTDVTGNVLNTTLTGFGSHDTIILGNANFSLSGTTDQLTDSYNNGTLVVTDTTNGQTVTIDVSLAAGVDPSKITLDDSTGQLVIHLCFYPGTHIATPEGEVMVETLRAGDMVVTGNGAKPVRWVGQSHVHTRFADPLRSLPIRIKAGALGGGLPVRDLLLSPDHALFLDGILVQASALVNGESIVREYDAPEQFTYYHVELETHELLLAEGALAESFVDNVDRMHFHNWDEREAPVEAIVEMDYPRAKSARQVPMAIRQRLSGNATNAA